MLLKFIYDVCRNCGKLVHKTPGYCLLCGCVLPQCIPVAREEAEDASERMLTAA